MSWTTSREHRNAYYREYQRRKREALYQERLRTARRCPYRYGIGRCLAPLMRDVDALGRDLVWCPACERRKRGVCRDCPRPVQGVKGLAWRCASCKKTALRRQHQAYDLRHHEQRRAAKAQRFRRVYWANPEKFRERARKYRRDHPAWVAWSNKRRRKKAA